MGIVMRLDSTGMYCPTFACDVCGEDIVTSGNYHWLVDSDMEPMEPVYFVHKACNRILTA